MSCQALTRSPRVIGELLPGAQLRITDVDGHRITAFVTNASRGQLADLKLRHRRRARCEDRTRGAKDTGLRNLPLHDFVQNRIWCAIVALAYGLATKKVRGFDVIHAVTPLHHDPNTRCRHLQALSHRLYSPPADLVVEVITMPDGGTSS